MNYAMLVARRRPASKPAGATISFTQQPTSQAATDGAATFSALAAVSDESSPTYQWQKQEGGAGVWSNVSGATSSSLALSGLTVAADSGDKYRVVASSPSSASVTSDAATLTVVAPAITVTQHPTSQTAAAGAAAFSVSAASSPVATLAYQWQRSRFLEIAWEPQTLPSTISSSAGWSRVAYGSGRFVAVGSSSSASVTSTDGTNWIRGPLPQSPSWGGVAFGANLFVATALWNTAQSGTGIAVTNTAATSTDGVTWTQRSLPVYSYWNGGVAFGNNIFVAVTGTNNDVAATSTNGLTWTQRTRPMATVPNDIAYGASAGVFVAVGSGGDALLTANGIAWTVATLPLNTLWRRIAFGGNKFVAMAGASVSTDTAVIATSEDGFNWTQRALPTAADWRGLTYGDGKFVAVAHSQNQAPTNLVATSTDGVTWTLHEMPSANNWGAVGFGGGNFAAFAIGRAAAYGPPGTAWRNITGATSSTLALTGLTSSNDQDQYRAVVSAANATPVTSSSATLTVN